MPRPFPPTGLPEALARDGWWFDAPSPPERAPERSRALRPAGMALLALVALGDLLFWGHAPGLSVAVFALALFGAGVAVRRPARWKGPLALMIGAVLPVMELVQPLSLALLGLGLLAALAWAHGAPGQWARTAAGLLLHLPQALPAALPALWAARPRGLSARGALRGWALPLGGGLVLLALLMQANPILSDWLQGWQRPGLDLPRLLARALFWAGLALLIWPLLTPAPLAPLPRLRPRALPGLNAEAVARALVLFNAVLAVQTAMDALFLWGGAALPPGMSAAEYAHRGAYPLMAAALLAGLFALLARPFLAERRGLKPLMMLWIGQNVALTASALLRLEHYVGLYGLTWLRLAAAIWMALVALGLMLVAVQIARGFSTRWLMIRCAGLGLGTLYLCSFLNFAAVVARVNLTHPAPDMGYTCALGPMAAAELAAHPRGQVCLIELPQIEGWRDWGFRAARVLRYTNGVTEAVR
ncbi:MAG: DUF4173 domain-containing protein [Gemmobacter sp.]|uniref:DUF4153 domain-containing protein n=1 Tax=Gemmobacter sp. TaxID=1898957 RepID=UPI001A45C0FA|nr:DUF4173 domain-containing protein [Gemmobacter sp.]MBL8561320.1 DUF4173 domain-containing protein [Gemmobacter sp.]